MCNIYFLGDVKGGQISPSKNKYALSTKIESEKYVGS